MRGARARKLVTISEHRRRQRQMALAAAEPAIPRPPDASEAETGEFPVLVDNGVEVEEHPLDVVRAPLLKPRSAQVEPLRTDWEERYRA